MNLNYYNRKSEEVIKELHTSEKGLSLKERTQRLDQYGDNSLVEYQDSSYTYKFLEGLKNVNVIVLFLAFIISLLIGKQLEAFIIAGFALINMIILFAEKVKIDSDLKSLQSTIHKKTFVLIDGVKTQVDTTSVVPGDIIVLEEGMGVPADARIINQNDLRIYEKQLVGDSTPIRKFEKALLGEHILHEQNNLVFMGTRVSHGSGLAVVIKTGMNTEFGKIADHSQDKGYESPVLHKQLNHIETISSFAVVLVGLFVFALGLSRGVMSFSYAGTMLLFTLSLAIAIIPETLHLIVAITLTDAAKKLSKENVFVKKLSYVESIGKTSVICTNKTGVLTKNEFVVTDIYVDNKRYNVTGEGYTPNGEFLISGKTATTSEMLSINNILRIAAICNDSRLEEDLANDKWRIDGDLKDGSIIVAARKAGLIQEELWKKYPKYFESPYDSHSKRMVSVNKINSTNIASVKGLPDVLIEGSTQMIIDGKIIKLDRNKKDELYLKYKSIAKRGLSVVAVAYKVLPSKIQKYESINYNEELVFVGLLGISDPFRPGTKEAIADCLRAGIKLVVFTDDSKEQAYSLATEIGLANQKVLVVNEKELSGINDEMLLDLFEEEVIFCGISGLQKKRIIKALQRMGHVVTALGDKSLDVPMINHADIGISIDVIGTQAAKEASKIILKDTGFKGLISAIKVGRSTFENIKKFTGYTISSKLGEAMTIFFGMVLGFPLPLLAIQLIGMDIVTKGLPSIALANEEPESDVMDKSPRRKNEPLIDRKMLFRFLFVGIIVSAITLLFFGVYLNWEGWRFGMGLALDSQIYIKATTLVLATLMMFQLVNALSSRSEHDSIFRIGLLTNRKMVVSLMLSMLILIGIINIPYLQSIFHTTELSLQEWLMIIGIAGSIFVLDEIRKVFVNYNMHKAVASSPSKAKINSRFDLKITALSLVVLVLFMSFYFAFGNNSLLGQQGGSGQLMANEPFVVKLNGAQEYSDIITIDSPAEYANLKIGGVATQTKVFLGSKMVFYSDDTLGGESYTLKMYTEPKTFDNNDEIVFEMPVGSRVESASVRVYPLEKTKEELLLGLKINNQLLNLGTNDITDFVEYKCNDEVCKGILNLKIYDGRQFRISDLEVKYSTPGINLKPIIDELCAAYPCELSLRISSDYQAQFNVNGLEIR